MTNTLKKNKKSLVTIISISLLLIVVVSSAVFLQDFILDNESTLFTKASLIAPKNSVQLGNFDANSLAVLNNNNFDLTYINLKIDNLNCNINGTLKKNSISILDLGFCLDTVKTGAKNVAILTNAGIFSKTMMLNNILNGPIQVVFKLGTTCDFGYTKLYALEYLTNSHTEISSNNLYTYSVCIKHKTYTLSNSCSGNFVNLFYLDNITNAHSFTDKTTPYLPISTWQNICLNSNLGSLNLKVNSTDISNSTTKCIGSFDGVDNIYGSHIGDCSAYQSRIWINIK